MSKPGKSSMARRISTHLIASIDNLKTLKTLKDNEYAEFLQLQNSLAEAKRNISALSAAPVPSPIALANWGTLAADLHERSMKAWDAYKVTENWHRLEEMTVARLTKALSDPEMLRRKDVLPCEGAAISAKEGDIWELAGYNAAHNSMAGDINAALKHYKIPHRVPLSPAAVIHGPCHREITRLFGINKRGWDPKADKYYISDINSLGTAVRISAVKVARAPHKGGSHTYSHPQLSIKACGKRIICHEEHWRSR